MSRVYITPSWVGAAENWSGDSPDNRKCSSTEIFLPNGKANTSLFNDKPPRKPKVKRSAYETICLADSRLNRLESLLRGLEEEHEKGLISWEDFIYARKQLQPRIDRAWRQINKARGWDIEEKELDKPSVPSISYTQKHKDSFMDNISDENIFKVVWTKAQKVIKLIAMIRMEMRQSR